VKLLLETPDRAVLLEKAALLRAHGIPVHLEDVPHVGAVPAHLYVVFDRHFEDAVSLLRDSGHVVSCPVFEDELEGIAEQMHEASLSVGGRLLDALMIGILVILAVVWVASRVFG
jgi:hypothetical protein